jgi:hypothetical protein
VGGGFGHGVGLSQYGAHNLAKLGWSGEQILSFYYPGAQIQPLSDSIVFWQEPQEPVVRQQPKQPSADWFIWQGPKEPVIPGQSPNKS